MKRLHSTTDDDFERALLSSARRVGPSPEAVRAVAATMAAAAVSSAVAGTASAAAAGQLTLAGKLAALSTATKVAIAVVAPIAVAGAVAGGSVFVDHPPANTPTVVEARSMPSQRREPSPARPPGPAETDDAISPESLPVAQSADLPRVVGLSPSAAPLAPVASEPAPVAAAVPGIAEEVRRLDYARAALASGRAAVALTLVSSYERDFPRGALAREAQVVRIEAYAELGQASTASRLAAEFVARHPNDPHTARLRTMIEATPDR